jgi:hypothetical protein
LRALAALAASEPFRSIDQKIDRVIADPVALRTVMNIVTRVATR